MSTGATARRATLRLVVVALCVAVVASGAQLVGEGLRERAPEATPTPEVEFSISPEEALGLASAGADGPVELSTPGDADQWEFVNTAAFDLPEPGPAGPANPGSHLYIPSIRVSAPVVPQGVTDANQMSLPEDLRQVGLLDTTSPLDATAGSTLVAGHVTQQGRHGALYFLGLVRPGATVLTVDAAGAHTQWAVTSVRNYNKTSLPPHIFVTTGERQLVLVTCGGEILRTPDGRWTHEDNIVVTATPLS